MEQQAIGAYKCKVFDSKCRSNLNIYEKWIENLEVGEFLCI